MTRVLLADDDPLVRSALMLMLSVTVPAEDGAKVALNVMLCPGASVTGKLMPLIE